LERLLFLAVGDFNGDGFQDLATADALSNTVTVLLGNGAAGFVPAPNSPFSVGNNPNSVVVGDFNGDGLQDLATSDGGDLTVTVLLGNGSGGFQAAPGTPSAVGVYTYALTVGDFNGDGVPDLITPATIVLPGDGKGGFTAASGPFAAGYYYIYSLAVGDFNGDGIEDVAVANSENKNVTVLMEAPAETDSLLSTSSPLTIGVGQSLPLSLSVFDTTTAFSPPAGPAAFFDGEIVLGTSSEAGTPYSFTAANLSPGSHILTASYSGVAGTSGSVSNSIVIQVVQIGATPQVITFPAPAPATLPTAGFALMATASSGLPVSYTSTTRGICTVSGPILTPIAAGKCSITAAQTGDATYASATPVAVSFVINPAPATTNAPLLTGIANAAGAGQARPSTVAVGGYVAIYGLKPRRRREPFRRGAALANHAQWNPGNSWRAGDATALRELQPDQRPGSSESQAECRVSAGGGYGHYSVNTNPAECSRVAAGHLHAERVRFGAWNCDRSPDREAQQHN